MKRYVKEFANDILKRDRECVLMPEVVKTERKAKVERLLKCYRMRILSDFEAVQQLVYIAEQGGEIG